MKIIDIIVPLLFSIVWIVVAWLIFRRNKVQGFVVACLCIGFLSFTLVRANVSHSFSPPPFAQSLRQFIQTSDQNYQISVLTLGSDKYYEAIPQWTTFQNLTSLILFRSGPPSYIFDQKGHLVDWTPDRDEDSRYSNRWKTGQRQSLSVQQMLRQMNTERDEDRTMTSLPQYDVLHEGGYEVQFLQTGMPVPSPALRDRVKPILLIYPCGRIRITSQGRNDTCGEWFTDTDCDDGRLWSTVYSTSGIPLVDFTMNYWTTNIMLRLHHGPKYMVVTDQNGNQRLEEIEITK